MTLFLPPAWDREAPHPEPRPFRPPHHGPRCGLALRSAGDAPFRPLPTEYLRGRRTAGPGIEGEQMAELRLTLDRPLQPQPGDTLVLQCLSVPTPAVPRPASIAAALTIGHDPHTDADAAPAAELLLEEVAVPQ